MLCTTIWEPGVLNKLYLAKSKLLKCCHSWGQLKQSNPTICKIRKCRRELLFFSRQSCLHFTFDYFWHNSPSPSPSPVSPLSDLFEAMVKGSSLLGFCVDRRRLHLSDFQFAKVVFGISFFQRWTHYGPFADFGVVNGLVRSILTRVSFPSSGWSSNLVSSRHVYQSPIVRRNESMQCLWWMI